MKLYSDTLTLSDLEAAAPSGCYLVANPASGRLRKNVWEFRLLNHEPRRNGWAATYDEHGEWMSALYAQDSRMIVGPYKDYSDFHTKTRNRYVRSHA